MMLRGRLSQAANQDTHEGTPLLPHTDTPEAKRQRQQYSSSGKRMKVLLSVAGMAVFALLGSWMRPRGGALATVQQQPQLQAKEQHDAPRHPGEDGSAHRQQQDLKKKQVSPPTKSRSNCIQFFWFLFLVEVEVHGDMAMRLIFTLKDAVEV
eukprot:TRINITY_DN778_c0_g2_i1.p1 TRINITY_DN778_c0_g2~~TRINITY_DN778_c0_g2_i1.p1  ORF type:complete len:152 (-),score=35.31 TRINITY_DN778_c0_g2_i1:1981-2436(-)